MPQKFLTQNAGALKEVAANTTSAGAGDAGKIPALDSGGRLDMSFMPTGLGSHTQDLIASEAIAAGAFINIYDNGGVFTMRNADAASGKRAHGFVLSAVSNGATGTAYPCGLNNVLSGLTAGDYFLSASAVGAATKTVPTGANQIVQRLGTALTATTIDVDFGVPITLA